MKALNRHRSRSPEGGVNVHVWPSSTHSWLPSFPATLYLSISTFWEFSDKTFPISYRENVAQKKEKKKKTRIQYIGVNWKSQLPFLESTSRAAQLGRERGAHGCGWRGLERTLAERRLWSLRATLRNNCPARQNAIRLTGRAHSGTALICPPSLGITCGVLTVKFKKGKKKKGEEGRANVGLANFTDSHDFNVFIKLTPISLPYKVRSASHSVSFVPRD